MNDRILKLYKINLNNTILSIKGFPSTIDKTITTSNLKLSEFLYGWDSIDDITTELLPVIDSILNNDSEEEDASSETVGSIVRRDITILYGLTNGASPRNPDFVLPTNDFKEILEGWLDFLGSSPINGTKV